MMEVQIKAWGNSQGIRFPKDWLKQAGFSQDQILQAEVSDGRIVLTVPFRHRTLEERAAAYDGKLLLSEETDRDPPVGREVW